MKRTIIGILTVLALIGIIVLQQCRMKAIRNERNAYRQDTYVLLNEMNDYRTKDSLNAVSVSELQLKLSEVEQYRSEDMKLIASLQADRKRLQQITSAQTQTNYSLNTIVRDSIVYRDHYQVDTIRCIDIAEKWFDLHGCIDANSKFAGKFENRDSLLYVEHVIPKRFLFIKWGIKERRQEIVSRNPHTKITGAEFITVRK